MIIFRLIEIAQVNKIKVGSFMSGADFCTFLVSWLIAFLVFEMENSTFIIEPLTPHNYHTWKPFHLFDSTFLSTKDDMGDKFIILS